MTEANNINHTGVPNLLPDPQVMLKLAKLLLHIKLQNDLNFRVLLLKVLKKQHLTKLTLRGKYQMKFCVHVMLENQDVRKNG